MSKMEISNVETGVQLFSRLKGQPFNLLDGINPKLFPNGGPLEDQVIEVSYCQDVDHTDFLLDFIARAVLPSDCNPCFKESQVIVLNTDFHIDVFKVIKYMERKLDTGNRDAVLASLKRIIILNCYSPQQLEASFYNIERVLNHCEKPSLVVLEDSLAHYWIQKFDEPMLSFDKYSANVVGMLYQKIKDMNVVLMYGKPLTGGEGTPGPHAFYSMHLGTNEKGFEVKVKDLMRNCAHEVKFTVDEGVLMFE